MPLHTYGHNDSWRVLPAWKQALHAPGATQLGHLEEGFLAREERGNLVPDQTVFASGGNVEGQVPGTWGPCHKDAKWALVYLGSPGSFEIRMDKISGAGKVKASWIDPKSGDSTPAGSFPNTGVQAFSTPEGWEETGAVETGSRGIMGCSPVYRGTGCVIPATLPWRVMPRAE